MFFKKIILNQQNGRIVGGREARGFTLIELTIVLVIVGLFIAAVATLAKPYFAEKQRTRTVDAIRTVEQAMADYLDKFNAYPCPAPLSTARGTAADGVGVRDSSGLCTTATGVTSTPGMDGSTPVLIGAIPYRDLNIPVDATIDAFHNRLTYAVSINSTVPAGLTYVAGAYWDGPDDITTTAVVEQHSGNIDIRDESGTTLLNPATPAHIFFFSHGRNGSGAYTNDGNIAGGTGSCASAGTDTENCDGDAIFLAQLQSHGTTYHDDMSTYSLLLEGEGGEYWGPGMNGDDIVNLNPGRVGIGTNNPQAALDVDGAIKVGDAVVCNSGTQGSMRFVGTNPQRIQYCDGATSQWRNFVGSVSCGNGQAVDRIDANGVPQCGVVLNNMNDCPAGQAFTGISNGIPQCGMVAPMAVSAPNIGTCPAGKVLRGMDAMGNLICDNVTIGPLVVRTNTAIIKQRKDGDADSQASASCNAGETLVTGGCEEMSSSGGGTIKCKDGCSVFSYPSSNSWVCQHNWAGSSAQGFTVKVYALCASASSGGGIAPNN